MLAPEGLLGLFHFPSVMGIPASGPFAHTALSSQMSSPLPPTSKCPGNLSCNTMLFKKAAVRLVPPPGPGTSGALL